jgi:hypothetical protein
MVVAWRIMDINRAARLEPQAAADQWLCTQEWQALYCYVVSGRKRLFFKMSLENKLQHII